MEDGELAPGGRGPERAEILFAEQPPIGRIVVRPRLGVLRGEFLAHEQMQHMSRGDQLLVRALVDIGAHDREEHPGHQHSRHCDQEQGADIEGAGKGAADRPLHFATM